MILCYVKTLAELVQLILLFAIVILTLNQQQNINSLHHITWCRHRPHADVFEHPPSRLASRIPICSDMTSDIVLHFRKLILVDNHWQQARTYYYKDSMHKFSLETMALFHRPYSCHMVAFAAAANSCHLRLAAKICTSSR